jgi:cation diffusion facilitator family transporter
MTKGKCQLTRHAQNDKTKDIRTAAVIALIGNAILAALKISVGIFSGSIALIGDGIDSSADVLIAVVTLGVVKIIAYPADRNHPWGHAKAETVAVAVLSFIVFFAGAQLIFHSAVNIFSGVPREIPAFSAVIATLISIAGKILLAYSQYIFGRRSDSAIIRANAKNMACDIVISLGVLAGLALSTVTGFGLADTIAAALIGAWVIKTAIGIFLEANLELMDGSVDMEQYRIVFDAVKSVEGAGHPHRARMRSIGGFWDIDLDVEVNPKLTVLEAHRIASQIENEIKRRLENVFDIVIHIEPQGDHSVEKFGLSPDEKTRL